MASSKYPDFFTRNIQLFKNIQNILAHVVVKWLNEGSFSIVKLGQVVPIHKKKPLEVDKVYSVFFENDHFDGQIKAIGDLVKCKLMLKNLSDNHNKK